MVVKNNREYLDLVPDKRLCCGCGGCYSICPAGAIQMEPDTEGFLYPVIDKEKCILCHKCLKVCVFKQDLRNKKADK